MADLAGGAVALLDRAETLAADGDLRQACHLADFALEATPADAEVQARVAALPSNNENKWQSLASPEAEEDRTMRLQGDVSARIRRAARGAEWH